MSFTTFFQFTHTSYLPLPPTKLPGIHASDGSPTNQETADQIQDRGIKTALKMLHSPETMIALNPLVQHYNVVRPTDPDSSSHMVDLDRLAPEFNVSLAPQPNCSRFADSKNGEFVHYEIVDKFQLLGGMTSKLLTYRACFRPLYDSSLNALPADDRDESIGLETISDPGNGVALLGKWIVGIDEQKPGYLVLNEIVKVHCNVFMGWFVKSQLESAHAQLHKEFGMKFCQRMIEEDPTRGMDLKIGKTWKESEELRRSGTGSASVSRVGTDETN